MLYFMLDEFIYFVGTKLRRCASWCRCWVEMKSGDAPRLRDSRSFQFEFWRPMKSPALLCLLQPSAAVSTFETGATCFLRSSWQTQYPMAHLTSVKMWR